MTDCIYNRLSVQWFTLNVYIHLTVGIKYKLDVNLHRVVCQVEEWSTKLEQILPYSGKCSLGFIFGPKTENFHENLRR